MVDVPAPEQAAAEEAREPERAVTVAVVENGLADALVPGLLVPAHI